MKNSSMSGLRRIAALGLGLAMIGGLSLVAATPATAETVVPTATEAPAVTYSVSGSVLAADGADAGMPLAGAGLTINGESSVVTDENGEFALTLEPGEYELGIEAVGYSSDYVPFTVTNADVPLGAISLTAVPADEEEPATFSINGVVTAKDGKSNVAASVRLSGIEGSSDWTTQANQDGTFTFEGLAPNADLTIEVTADGYGSVTKSVPVTDADVDVAVELLPFLTNPGTVKISGTPVVGNVLTASTSGWPAGTTLSYQWGFSGGQYGGPIDGATKNTYTVTSDQLGMMLSVFVTGTKDGFAPTTQSQFMSTAVSAAKKDAAAAPAGDSGGLAVYLEGRGVTAQSQTSAGLPAGDLNPGEDYEAELKWTATDSYVDVYLYSTPTLVGTFPVVNGAVQITLSAEVLSELEAGNHTLVVTGQSSGAVQAVALTVADMLAATGFNAGGPLAIAVLLLLLGAALLVVRRRRVHA